MTRALRFLSTIFLGLLLGSMIISTKWILEIYASGRLSTLSPAHLDWISWYFTAPSLLMFLIFKGLEVWMAKRTGS